MWTGIYDKIRSLTWTRNRSGTNIYTINKKSYGQYSNLSNLTIAQTHPILSPAILFIAKLFAQAEFKVINKETKEEVKDHWMIKLLGNPNAYQTKSDFLESLQFIQIAQGKAVGYLKRPTGFKSNEDIDSIYILDSDKIDFPENYKSKILSRDSIEKRGVEVVYDKKGENLKINTKDLIFFYDLPNMLCDNFFTSKSRIDGLRQTLYNTCDSLIAKNIILKTNGKEIISSGDAQLPLMGDDKKRAEELVQNNYGLGWWRNRAMVISKKVDYKSLHIALRDLGLDESVKVDGNLIYTALHIPKDILSLEAKKTTYNNFKESMVSYIQNEIQTNVDSFTDVLNKLMSEDNLKVVGSLEHLPVMQYILRERYEGISAKAKALNDLLKTGIPQEVALELCGFDKNLKLEEIQTIENTNSNNSQNENNNNTSGEEEED